MKAKLCFNLVATDAVKFTIYRIDKTVDGNENVSYSLKTIQSVALKKVAASTFKGTLKTALLSAGTYCISMNSTNAAKGGCAYYNVVVDTRKSSFYEDIDDEGEDNYDFGYDDMEQHDLSGVLESKDACALSMPETSGFAQDVLLPGIDPVQEASTAAMASLDIAQGQLFGDAGNGILAAL